MSKGPPPDTKTFTTGPRSQGVDLLTFAIEVTVCRWSPRAASGPVYRDTLDRVETLRAGSWREGAILEVKTAAVVLGIVGGVLAALLALFIMALGASVIVGCVILLGAVLGIGGGVVARKNPTLGGILMLVAGGLDIFGGRPGFIIGALLITGGILALVAANAAKKAAPPRSSPK